MKIKILIVEDQFIEANNLRIILKKAGYVVCPIARSVMEAEAIIGAEQPDIVLLDIYLDGPQTGIDLAHILNKRNIAFIFLSANSDKATLTAAKATNPYGFLVKPFRERDVLVMLDVALYTHQQRQPTAFDTTVKIDKTAELDAFRLIKGKSGAFQDVLNQVSIVGQSDVSVLVLGESGTGKELIAKAIHQVSKRKDQPLVIVNCAALPANLIESELFGHEKGAFTGAIEKRIGKFEQANNGTIFLDEVGELPLDLQVKFLRVLQEKEIEPIAGKRKPVNVRVIAATNKNLTDEVAAGRFRMDLFYRLNVFPILLPPLRDRRDDIVLLADYFLKIFSVKEHKNISGFSDQAIKELITYNWPGNIRELENMIERSVLLATGSLITAISVPSSASKTPVFFNRVKTMDENERDNIIAVLEHCNWKIYGKGGAAELLAINGNTLHSRMKKLGIEKQIGPK